MKIMWVTNILPQYLAKKIGLKTINNLGWLDYSLKLISENPLNSFFVVFPYKENISGQVGLIKYSSFPIKYSLKESTNRLLPVFKKALLDFEPDVIHIHGTEYYHSYSFCYAAKQTGFLEKIIISIQGLVSVYANHYFADLPAGVIYGLTVRDVLRRNNIYLQRNNYAKRGKYEVLALQLARNVIGRTSWDKACISFINRDSKYFECNETLRECFYYDKWSFSKCRKHSIFSSQSSYTIKGVHKLIEGFVKVLDSYPDSVLYLTGQDVFKIKWYRIDSYHKYIKKMIKKHRIKDKVYFLGTLNAEDMKKQFLLSNVFVLPSSIENSPNSLGEAMILGVPCVASNVGGVGDMMRPEDGFLYPFNESYKMAFYIKKVFEIGDKISLYTKKSIEHALHVHNPITNRNTLLSIYQEVINKNV